VARRSGLGKGLSALIPNEVVGDQGSSLVEIPVSSLRSNPHQPRSHFDETTLAALTASIREVGVLQPILARPLASGDYEVIAGERRWRAARRAGLATIPAIVREVTEVTSVEHALVENLHRQDLSPLEEAAAYQQLIEDFGLTHEQVSSRVGRSRGTVTNALRLFQLPPSVQKLVADGQLSAGHARAVLGTPDRAFQEALARRAVTEQLSVRAVEDAVRERNEDAAPSPRGPRTSSTASRPAALLELEDRLSALLDTRVTVNIGGRRGRLVVDFATLEDLERIYRAMVGEQAPPADG
jgi:ParB family transcriptional regulator, chromosome partitioning protein